jgi:bis(5'-nucleosyl)-tetraphosphatase (symmetrical)
VQPVFVGDIQGCADELHELLGRLRAAFGQAFELWLVGDLVNRGPANLAVLETVHDLVERGRARVVLGNHDVGLLAVAAGLRAPRPSDTFGDVLASPELGRWVDWLRRRPLAATGVLGETPFAMVHAAVAPSWRLEDVEAHARRAEMRLAHPDRRVFETFLAEEPAEEPVRDDLERLVQCRTARADGSWSPEEPARPEDAWHCRWSAQGHAYGVVYGHWSLQGLHAAPGLRGLDTGCVHHGRGRDGFLTAWLPDPRSPRPFDVPDRRFEQVRAHRRYIVNDVEPAC